MLERHIEKDKINISCDRAFVFSCFIWKSEKKERRNHKWSDQKEPELNTQKEKKQPLWEDLKCSEETHVYSKLSGGVRIGSGW